jgi:hypothetical protein
MQKYTFYWKNGKRRVLRGTTTTDALRRADLAPEAINKVEMVFKGDNKEYKWLNNRWVKRVK